MPLARDKQAGPLSHVTVVDLTTFLSGPYGTQILGDLGANIVKIESPNGDMTRALPPHFIKGDSVYFHSINRNKQSLVLDLKKAKGRELFINLVRKADIVVENFRPGVMERLGIGYKVLSQANPKIIYCAITGFGRDGPYRDRPAYDIIVQALSGSMSITGEVDGKPVRAGLPIGDLAAGMFGVIGILAALAQRDSTGQGQYVETSMLDCQISMLSYQAAYYLASGKVPGPQGRGHESIPTYRSFTCADDEDVVIAANTEKMWQILCLVLDRQDLLREPRFSTGESRLQNKDLLWQILDTEFRKRPAAEWLELLVDAGVPAAPLNSLDKALIDPQVLHRNMIVTTRHPDGDLIRLIGNPIKFETVDSERFEWAPSLGEHSAEILSELLQLTPEQISMLEEEGVISSLGRSPLSEHRDL